MAIDFNGKIILENKSFLQLIGKPKTSVVGKSIGDVICIFQNNTLVPISKLLPEKSMKTDQVIATLYGAQLNLSSDDLRSVNIISSTIKEREEVGFGAIIVVHDLTEENQLELMKLDFVSIAAHELRTPLTSIQGYLSAFMQEKVWDSLSNDQRMLLDRVNISAKHLSALMENLLTVSNIEGEEHNLNINTHDWGKITY
ncbi:hypothetical protein CO179_03410 [candidate division WWE3 bacterium CG_4_9_14_3_um_filter_39_7]|uniref:histidine kinase n=1 Tax=candidate division WWE3 bacterium CG_4_9_14_3_um_filter_39_7 TaxID=1975080 RepID=A0A2M7X1V8_UNCKA|nr:MAG: hypothetical protein CO179_03410 [candidate division WWE3 bacterium CG_4_9_14_3_um_filter_39_7]